MFKTGRFAGTNVETLLRRDPVFLVSTTMYGVSELFDSEDKKLKAKGVPFGEPHRYDVNQIVIDRIIRKREKFDYRPEAYELKFPGLMKHYPYSVCRQIQTHEWWDTLEKAPLAEQKKMILSEEEAFMDVERCSGVHGLNAGFFARLRADVENPEAVEAARALCHEKSICLHCCRPMTKASRATPNTGFSERFIHKMCWFKKREDYRLWSYGRNGYEGPNIPCKHKEAEGGLEVKILPVCQQKVNADEEEDAP